MSLREEMVTTILKPTLFTAINHELVLRESSLAEFEQGKSEH